MAEEQRREIAALIVKAIWRHVQNKNAIEAAKPLTKEAASES